MKMTRQQEIDLLQRKLSELQSDRSRAIAQFATDVEIDRIDFRIEELDTKLGILLDIQQEENNRKNS